MNRVIYIAFLVFCVVISAQKVSAQYYTWGSDPASLKWSQLKTPDVRIIYPDTAEGIARRTLFYIDKVKPYIGYGFKHSAMNIPFVLHTENFQSNGLVMWLPKRVEFLTSPAINSYSMPWHKQLVAHEYRHAVQYNNLNRGVIRVLSYILGQQGSTIGLMFMPIWAIEGDAVMSETSMSSFGRGLQPRFTIEYRAMGNIANSQRNHDKWFCGSYREFIPNHYQLGYQISSYAYDKYDENIWDKVGLYGVRNPYMILTTMIAIRKFYKTSVSDLYNETFSDLYSYWSSLPAIDNSSSQLIAMPEKNYTTYSHPISAADNKIIALKDDFDTPQRFVEVDPETGSERLIARTGRVSTRPTSDGNRIWWTEYRRSKLFEQRVNSQLCYMDLSDGKPKSAAKHRNTLYPTTIDDKGIAWVEYNPNGRYTIIRKIEGWGTRSFDMPPYSEVHGLAWDNATQKLYFITTDDDGMWIGTFDDYGRVKYVTQAAYITISDLRASDGKLYFGSIASGKDEAHCIELASGREYRLTSSTYGSFSPAPLTDSTLAVTTYDKAGYHLARQSIDTTGMYVTPAKVPPGFINPPRKSWNLINLDTVRYDVGDSVSSYNGYRSKHYRKGATLFKVHSWMPFAVNPFKAIDEHDIAMNLGVTLLSQNLLSNTEAYLSYGWNRAEGSVFKAAIKYFGLGLHIDAQGTYGGRQEIYAISQMIDNELKVQPRPSPDTYYSVGIDTSLPLVFQQGYHTRQFTAFAGWNYSNGLVADVASIKYNPFNGSIVNLDELGYKKGLHKISIGAGFSDYVRQSVRDFAPPWGYVVNASYTFNPANRSFGDLISVYGKVYTPGFFKHNSFVVAASYQTSTGGVKAPSGQPYLGYKSTALLPRGFSSRDILSDNYIAASANYEFPLCYPEGGISSVIYFKRIRLNIGGDYAQFDLPFAKAGQTRAGVRRIYSYGGDLIFDINVFRQPDSATSSIKLSVYKPSEGDIWLSAGVDLPF